MKKETIVYAYKGVIGIKSDKECDGLVNDPNGRNGMLYIIDTQHIKFSQEAIDLIKKIPVGTNSIGDIMAYKAADMVLFAFRSGPIKPGSNQIFQAIGKARVETKKDKGIESEVIHTTYGDVGFKPELLVATEGVVVDKSFMNYIDKLEADGKLSNIAIE